MSWQYFNGKLYLFQKRLPAVVFGVIDCIGEMTIGRVIRKKESLDKISVKKILISRPDHLGDVVMTSSILPVIKQAFPDARIHMLIGSWTKEIVENDKYVDEYITFDHFSLNRQNRPCWKKLFKMLSQTPKVLKVLRAGKYDLGIELRPFWGNTIPLMFLGGVKYRIGFETGGFGFLLHRSKDFSCSSHFIENMLQLLTMLDILVDHSEVKMRIGIPSGIHERISQLLSDSGVDISKDNLVVLHPGSGRKKALWQAQKWAILADALQQKFSIKVVFGGGPNEIDIVDEIISHMETIPINFTASISMVEFACLVKFSNLLVGLESASSHIAASVDTPSAVIHSGIQDICIWKPWGQHVVSITEKVNCSPCWQTNGCNEMNCIREVEAANVLEQVGKYLR